MQKLSQLEERLTPPGKGGLNAESDGDAKRLEGWIKRKNQRGRGRKIEKKRTIASQAQKRNVGALEVS